MRYVEGSARGVRVAGASWGGFVGAASVFGLIDTNADGWWWSVLAVPGFVIARPWWLGVYLTEGAVVIRSWFRRYTYASEQIEVVEMAAVYSGLLGAGTTWVPFVGSVRMMQLEIRGRYLPKSLPSTLGRRNTVLKVVRTVREHVSARAGADFTL